MNIIKFIINKIRAFRDTFKIVKTTFTYDSIVNSVLEKIKSRARIGKEKYGTDLDRKDLTFIEWVNHAQEEHMDAILYLEKMKTEYPKHTLF